MGLLKVAYSFTAQTPPMATLLVPIRGFRLVTHPIPLKKSPFRTIIFEGLALCKDQARPSTTVWFFGLECWPHYRGVGAKKLKKKVGIIGLDRIKNRLLWLVLRQSG
jgi:hypothetical protein